MLSHPYGDAVSASTSDPELRPPLDEVGQLPATAPASPTNVSSPSLSAGAPALRTPGPDDSVVVAAPMESSTASTTSPPANPSPSPCCTGLEPGTVVSSSALEQASRMAPQVPDSPALPERERTTSSLSYASSVSSRDYTGEPISLPVAGIVAPLYLCNPSVGRLLHAPRVSTAGVQTEPTVTKRGKHVYQLHGLSSRMFIPSTIIVDG